MGTTTGIEWCDHTWNAWRGCAKPGANADGTGVAPECWNCYAEDLAKRNPEVLGRWGKGATRAIAAEDYWKLPIKWNAAARREGVRRRVFFASMADVFEDRADLVVHRARAFGVIDLCPELDFLVLTKRPEHVRRFWPGGPRPNVWLGTSCGHPSSIWRVAELRKLRDLAALLFISAEPLLAPLDLLSAGQLEGIGWLICGGESGARDRVRPFDPDWARGLAMQCWRAGVPFFLKQFGSRVVENGYPCEPPDDPKGGDPGEWPIDLRIRELPATVTGP
jgi:protein gp37